MGSVAEGDWERPVAWTGTIGSCGFRWLRALPMVLKEPWDCMERTDLYSFDQILGMCPSQRGHCAKFQREGSFRSGGLRLNYRLNFYELACSFGV